MKRNEVAVELASSEAITPSSGPGDASVVLRRIYRFSRRGFSTQGYIYQHENGRWSFGWGDPRSFTSEREAVDTMRNDFLRLLKENRGRKHPRS